MMEIEKIKLTTEIKEQLTATIYVNLQNLGLNLTIPLDNKKSMMLALRDQQLDDADLETGGDFFSKEFAEVIAYESMRMYKSTDKLIATDSNLMTLPGCVINELKSKTYFKLIEKLSKDLCAELAKHKSLQGIKLYEIYHLLDINFANLASIHGLGYHIGNDNRSFQRFRLYAAICLSQCVVTAQDNLSDEQKLKMCKEIKNLLFTSQCAGQITNRLYGEYSSFNILTQRIQEILSTPLLTDE